MQTFRDFVEGGSRYEFDFGVCHYTHGWAQLDTSQDAPHFGTWADPERLLICTYAEGDITLQTASSADEFAAEIRRIADWNAENGHRFIGIDTGFSDNLRSRFVALGLAEFLH